MKRFSLYSPDAGGVVILLLLLFAGALLGNAAIFVIGLVFPGALGMDASMLISYPLMFLPLLIYAGAKSRKMSASEAGPMPMDSGRSGRCGSAACATAAVALTLCAAFACDALVSVLPPMPESLRRVMESMTEGDIVCNLISVSIMAPLCEEWLCRGLILRGCINHGAKPVVAVAVSAAFFALIHLNPWQAVPAFVMGCLFGYVYLCTGSLKLSMAMHCANNTFSVLMSRIDAFSDAETWLDVLPANIYWPVFAVCVAVIAALIGFFGKIH